MLLELKAVDVQGFVLLRSPYVVQHGPGGNRGSRVPVKAEPLERTHIELAGNEGHGEVASPHPVLDTRPRWNSFQARPVRRARCQQHLARAGQQKLIHGLLSRGWPGELCCSKLPCRHVDRKSVV